MIILAGAIRMPPERLAAAAPHIAALVEATRAEPGCLGYSYAHDALEPGLLRIFELFQDAEALAAHRASAHMAAWRARYQELGVHGRDLTLYDIAHAEKA